MSDTNQTEENSEKTENPIPQEGQLAEEKQASADDATQPKEEATVESDAASENDAGAGEAVAEGEAAADEAAEKAKDPEKKVETPAVPTAPRCENPIVGRKVFFVNPPLYVENYLHLELKQHEYEVYIITDYKYTKSALRKFPDALCFIFIDDELSYDEWFNFILSFQKDEKLKTIFVGLMSAIIPKPQYEKFMMNLSLPGGFIMLNEFKGSALIDKIVGILELNGAKGRRKYLRLDCEPTNTINGYFATKSQLLQVSILNISSVGFTCCYPKSYGEALAKNMLVPSFSITLGRRSIVTPSVVFDVKVVDANRLFAIMLFTKQVGEDDRKVIKNYIFEKLEEKFQKLIFSNQPDVEDYSNKKPKAAEPEEIEEMQEVEEAEAVEETEKSEAGGEAGASEEAKAAGDEKSGEDSKPSEEIKAPEEEK